MGILKEEQILFAGKDSYRDPENPTDRICLMKLISEIKDIIETEIGETHLSNPGLKKELNIDNNDPNIIFRLNYSSDDHLPDESIKEAGSKVQEKIRILLEKSYELNPNFYYGYNPGWNGSYLSYSLHVRPIRGTYKCQVCGEEIESSEEESIYSTIMGEYITACTKEDHETFFLKDSINQVLTTKEYCKISESLALHVVNTKEREHSMLAFQLSLIAKKEYKSFLDLNLNKNNPRMYILAEKGIPVGYAFWNDKGDERCLRQLFIREKFRRRNFGTLLVEKTADVESKNKIFIVETPNEKSLGILLKLGYVRKNERGVEYVKCVFCYEL